jgi:hypothetical protein
MINCAVVYSVRILCTIVHIVFLDDYQAVLRIT